MTPAEGVRPVGSLHPHYCGKLWRCRGTGYRPTRGFDFKSITALSGDKPKVLQAMKDSFAHFRNAMVALNDADAAKPQKMFNRETTPARFLDHITGHFGEHLGQSIAYARMKGIVPPWTEEAQQQTKSLWRNPSRKP